MVKNLNSISNGFRKLEVSKCRVARRVARSNQHGTKENKADELNEETQGEEKSTPEATEPNEANTYRILRSKFFKLKGQGGLSAEVIKQFDDLHPDEKTGTLAAQQKELILNLFERDGKSWVVNSQKPYFQQKKRKLHGLTVFICVVRACGLYAYACV